MSWTILVGAMVLLMCACTQNDASTGAPASTGPDDGSQGPAAGSAAGVGASSSAGNDAASSIAGAGGSDASVGAGGAGAGAAAPVPAGSSGEPQQPVPGAGGCTRELLASTVESYFAALAARDPARLPLADGVKFTENGEVLELGEGLWRNAGMVRYKHSALDVELCTSVSESVVPENGMDLPVGVRLKLEAQRLTEIETIVPRPGDYVLLGSPFASNPDAIVASASLNWEQPVPEADRATREEIAAWITGYFERFPSGGCNLGSECRRLENGGGSFPCSLGASCSQTSSGAFGGPLDPRLVVVDDVRGVGVGFTMFMGNTDMHMIMMRGGEIRAVHAILSGAEGSGWD
jgi:hypothetical protein